MASIYEIEEWSGASGDKWQLNKVVFYATNGKYYYCIKAHNRSYDGSVKPDYANSIHWAGHTTFDNKAISHFFWVPSYAPSISSEPKVKSVKFGDGYEQRTPEHISSSLISLSLAFDKRSEEEATAIAHFLHTRGAHEAFVFTPPSPYGSAKKFICKKWDTSVEFEGSYSVKATFEEVVE
tara:strand:- start:8973 stop:9512 length:540 start_codon:yes stop_codon:yes gene_type:complete